MAAGNAAAGPRYPECGKGTLVPAAVDDAFDIDLGEETVRVQARNVPVERCSQCGTVLSGPAAARVRHEAICRAAGFFSPAEVKELRSQLGLSQEELARLAGVGVATISRIERGRLVQNRSTDNLLYLIARSEEVRRLLTDRLAVRPRKAASPPTAQPTDATPSLTR